MDDDALAHALDDGEFVEKREFVDCADADCSRENVFGADKDLTDDFETDEQAELEGDMLGDFVAIELPVTESVAVEVSE